MVEAKSTAACVTDPVAGTHLMQCMEVWGGNQCVDSSCTMAGLDAWVYSRAYADATAGGDVYYVSSCATGRITRLLVADVSGHGSAVHEVAVGLRTLMHRFVNYIDQTRFVQAMNGQFTELSKSGNFATALVTTFFAPTNRLTLCNAGHPPPLLFEPAESRWRYLEHAERQNTSPTNLPFGIDVGNYEQFDVDLQLGDLVLCYTDALPESHDADGQMLGQDGLLRVLNGLEVADPATFVPRLLAGIAALNPANLTNDDVTVLLFRPNGSAPTTPLREKLLVPFRVARAIIRSLGRKDAPAPWPEMSVANVGGALVPALAKVGQPNGRRPGAPGGPLPAGPVRSPEGAEAP